MLTELISQQASSNLSLLFYMYKIAIKLISNFLLFFQCMKAYVEFEISEGAYEISCPDAQCPEQGAMTLPEIAILTTTNLMKKHHRYRLNRGKP